MRRESYRIAIALSQSRASVWAITNHAENGQLQMRSDICRVTKYVSTDLTPLYLLMTVGWFAVALSLAGIGRWLGVDLGGGAGLALGVLCLAHAIFESSCSTKSKLACRNPFAERCVSPKMRYLGFDRRVEWQGQAAV